LFRPKKKRPGSLRAPLVISFRPDTKTLVPPCKLQSTPKKANPSASPQTLFLGNQEHHSHPPDTKPKLHLPSLKCGIVFDQTDEHLQPKPDSQLDNVPGPAAPTVSNGNQAFQSLRCFHDPMTLSLFLDA